MKARLCYLSDVLGNRYLGFKFTPYMMQDYLYQWYGADNVGFHTLTTLATNRDERDGDHYHCTLVNVMDFNKLNTNTDDMIGLEVDFVVLGIGKAVDLKKGNEAHFIVLECEQLQAFRATFDLAPHDLHITIGFDRKDVFGQPKDRTSIYLPFKQKHA